MKKRSLAPAIVAIALILGAAVWGSRKISTARADAQRQRAGAVSDAVPVRTAFVSLGDVRNILTFNGDVQPLRTVDLQAKVSGRLAALSLEDGTEVEEGVPVKKGQRIGLLDDREYHAALSSAKAALSSAKAELQQCHAAVDSARANLEDKEREYNRMKGLVAQQAATQQSLDQAETAFATAKAEMASAEAKLLGGESAVEKASAEEEKASLDFAETRIYAPMDGVVSARHLDPGVQVTASTPLVTILAMDEVKVVISVPVKHLERVVPGKTRAFLRTPTTPEPIECLVEKVYPSVDKVTRTAQVELRVPNTRRDDGTYPLLPGMYATVELLMEERFGIVAVDVSLPIRNLDKQLVFVCQGDTVRAVPVTLGIATEGRVEVLSGLSEGDEVVVQGQHRLTDGSQIRRVAPENGAGAGASEDK